MARAMKKRRSDAQSPVRRMVAIVGLTVFLVVDLILVVAALDANRSNLSASEFTPKPSASAVPTPEATATSTPAPVTVVQPNRLVAALDGDVAWRSATGACPATEAAPEITTDGGTTWNPTNITASTQVVNLQRIVVDSESDAMMIGQNAADCSPALVRTFVGGDDYADYPEQLPAQWFVQPADHAVVHSPVGDVAAPCAAVITIAARDDADAAALCADQSIWLTADAGATWAASAAVAGALNIAASDAGYVAAAAPGAACAGVQIVSVALDATVAPTGCFPVPAEPSSLAGNVALAAGNGAIWLWAGDAFVLSVDGGVTWA
jgi:hypothetical protein